MYIIIYHYISLYIIIYHFIYHYISLYIIIYHYIYIHYTHVRLQSPHFVRSAVAEFHCSTKAPREDAAGGVAMKMGMGRFGG